MRDAAYFFLLLALVGRLYGSHVWAKEIEYVFFLLVLPKTSGSVQIDLTRIEQRNSTGIWLAAQHIAKSKYYFPMAGERVSRKYSQAEWNTSHFIILHPAINIARGIGSHFTYAYFAHIEASWLCSVCVCVCGPQTAARHPDLSDWKHMFQGSPLIIHSGNDGYHLSIMIYPIHLPFTKDTTTKHLPVPVAVNAFTIICFTRI